MVPSTSEVVKEAMQVARVDASNTHLVNCWMLSKTWRDALEETGCFGDKVVSDGQFKRYLSSPKAYGTAIDVVDVKNQFGVYRFLKGKTTYIFVTKDAETACPGYPSVEQIDEIQAQLHATTTSTTMLSPPPTNDGHDTRALVTAGPTTASSTQQKKTPTCESAKRKSTHNNPTESISSESDSDIPVCRDTVDTPQRADVHDEAFVEGNNTNVGESQRRCEGWSDAGWRKIIRASLDEAMKQGDDSGTVVLSHPPRVPLASFLSDLAGYNSIEVLCQYRSLNVGASLTNTNQDMVVYSIHSKDCVGIIKKPSDVFCVSCKLLVSKVANLKRKGAAMGDSIRSVTERNIALQSPSVVATVVKGLYVDKQRQLKNLSKRQKRLIETVERKVNKGIGGVEMMKNVDNLHTIRQVVEAAIPLLDEVQQFKDDPVAKRLFEHQLRRLITPINGPGGVPVCNEIFELSMALLNSCRPAMYEKLAPLLGLVHIRTAQKAANTRFQDIKDGPCYKGMETMKGIFVKQNFVSPWQRTGGIAYDTVYLSGSFMLSNRKEDNCLIVGASIPQDINVAKFEFEQYVQRISQKPDDNDVDALNRALSTSLKENKMHTVFYWTPMDPEISMKKYAFICGKYNTVTLKGSDVFEQIDEVIAALAGYGFVTIYEVSDAASNNITAQKQGRNILAKHFIPADILEKHKLDGIWGVARCQWGVNGGPYVFPLDDPPHMQKRMTNGMFDRKFLSWGDPESRPMCMLLLRDVYQSVRNRIGSIGHLGGSMRKHADSDFIAASQGARQNVGRSARVTSGTMYRAMQEVMEGDPSEYVLKTAPHIVTIDDRRSFMQRAMQLVLHMNRWFDVCNSKEKNHPLSKEKYNLDKVRITRSNGVQIADDLLAFLHWLHEWREGCTVGGALNTNYFIAEELFHSFRTSCYGLASMIYEYAIKQGHSFLLKRINQDIVEAHFSHCRYSTSGSSYSLTQQQAEDGDKHSSRNRMLKQSKKANTQLTYD